jgi:hypothetical protein
MKLNKPKNLPQLLTQLTSIHLPMISPSNANQITSFDDNSRVSRRRRYRDRSFNTSSIAMPTHDIGREAFNLTESSGHPARQDRYKRSGLMKVKSISPRGLTNFEGLNTSQGRSMNPLVTIVTSAGAYRHYSKRLQLGVRADITSYK